MKGRYYFEPDGATCADDGWDVTGEVMEMRRRLIECSGIDPECHVVRHICARRHPSWVRRVLRWFCE